MKMKPKKTEEAEVLTAEDTVVETEEAEVPPVEDTVVETDEAEVPPVEDTAMETEEAEASPLEETAIEDEEAEVTPAKDTIMESEEIEVLPVKEIREQLNNFEMKVPVWGLTVFTVDGYIIAHKLFYDAMPEEIGLAISSMSAGLITISEDFIRMVDSGNLFRQVLVDSEDTDGAVSFSILLKSIAENVLIACIFPSSTQLGLVTFEMENLSSEILDIVNRWDIKLHEDSIT
jgi:predicted regulator of Ras-like GTPase activity (Roadblock/LC7/MglB family)